MRVAVASNFLAPMRALARAFEQETGLALEIASGSTGRLYAQIQAGAPFDVFLAADAERPRRLVDSGLARRSSLRRYATGTLVVIAHVDAIEAASDAPTIGTAQGSRAAQPSPPACLSRLLAAPPSAARPLAIASPKTAPYGRAARQTLERLGLWTTLSPQLVRGENVAQAYHFVVSGNAAAGFVAASQLATGTAPSLSSCRWTVPETLHDPIAQEMVVLERSADRPAVKAFARFMTGETAARIVRDAGYGP